MSDIWIFGYGSLIWRPDFPHAEARPASIDGWARRFWQGSTDHRGVPGSPGRVVTLVEKPGSTCHGRAYRVGADARDAVIAGLDHREKGGYALRDVDILFEAGRAPVRGVVYIATPGNPNWLGRADMAEIAAQVAAAAGPSGSNAEYVLRLADAIRSMGAEDPHVFAVAGRLEPARLSAS